MDYSYLENLAEALLAFPDRSWAIKLAEALNELPPGSPPPDPEVYPNLCRWLAGVEARRRAEPFGKMITIHRQIAEGQIDGFDPFPHAIQHSPAGTFAVLFAMSGFTTRADAEAHMAKILALFPAVAVQ